MVVCRAEYYGSAATEIYPHGQYKAEALAVRADFDAFAISDATLYGRPKLFGQIDPDGTRMYFEAPNY